MTRIEILSEVMSLDLIWNLTLDDLGLKLSGVTKKTGVTKTAVHICENPQGVSEHTPGPAWVNQLVPVQT